MKHHRSAFLLWLGLLAAQTAQADDITAYKARIVPDIAAKSLSGTTRIFISIRRDAPRRRYLRNGFIEIPGLIRYDPRGINVF
ncbi:hypothetical protein [Massilia glaciei]|uniref:hypothetical protein n=1 Tax=Massilia glaciei TaxID=1524097 RepID=UPI000D0E4A8D|nr:hypothetical protein [Massilia glaciei]